MADDLTELTAKVVAAYLANNSVPVGDVPSLINTVHSSLAATASPQEALAPRQEPAVSVKRSVTLAAIICLECGRPHKMLKRHLSAAHGKTVDEYRAKWSLPANYPVVAPDYAARRSKLAMDIGLGRKPRA